MATMPPPSARVTGGRERRAWDGGRLCVAGTLFGGTELPPTQEPTQDPTQEPHQGPDQDPNQGGAAGVPVPVVPRVSVQCTRGVVPLSAHEDVLSPSHRHHDHHQQLQLPLNQLVPTTSALAALGEGGSGPHPMVPYSALGEGGSGAQPMKEDVQPPEDVMLPFSGPAAVPASPTASGHAHAAACAQALQDVQHLHDGGAGRLLW